MARTAGQMPRRLSSFDIGALFRMAVPPVRAGVAPAWTPVANDDLTARAIAYSGFAALLGLPALLLASIALGVGLAAPAAIALGYLATSYALASQDRRSATAINSIVLAGLVVWSLSFVLAGAGHSRVGLVAALLAPAFAAAPALARLILGRQTNPAASSALRNAACLDRLAPREAVLIVERDGTLLGATRAARTGLQLPGSAIGGDVGRCFSILDRPKLSDAIARCAADGEPVEVTLHGAHGGYMAGLSADAGGAVCIRLGEPPTGIPAPAVETDGDPGAPGHRAEPVCDVGEAVAFAVRHAEPILQVRRTLMTSAVEPGIGARCERQICRRILFLMIESAATRCDAGDTIHLAVRTVKSVVLLRLTRRSHVDARTGEAATHNDPHLVILRKLVEEAGGTVVADCSSSEGRITVRLDLAYQTHAKPGEARSA